MKANKFLCWASGFCSFCAFVLIDLGADLFIILPILMGAVWCGVMGFSSSEQ